MIALQTMEPDEFGEYVEDLQRQLQAAKDAGDNQLYNKLIQESDETYRQYELALIDLLEAGGKVEQEPLKLSVFVDPDGEKWIMITPTNESE